MCRTDKRKCSHYHQNRRSSLCSCLIKPCKGHPRKNLLVFLFPFFPYHLQVVTEYSSLFLLILETYTHWYHHMPRLFQEAKIAKDRGILLITLSLEDAYLTLLKDISHIVQEYRTAIDWPSLVACPS